MGRVFSFKAQSQKLKKNRKTNLGFSADRWTTLLPIR